MHTEAVALGPHGLRLPWAHVDVIGDVHGCHQELVALLGRIGYKPDSEGAWRHPTGRRLIFVGDLCNRGPHSLAVLDLVATTVESGAAMMALGNHDHHLLGWLRGETEARGADLRATAAAYDALEQDARATSLARHRVLLESAPLFVLLDPTPLAPERLVVAHAAWRPEVIDAPEDIARRWCLYGPDAGRDENDRPIRLDWTRCYPSAAPYCVVGHTAYDGPVVLGAKTVCIDTGCAYGGRITALRWPEMRVVQESALREWHHHPSMGPSPNLTDPETMGPAAVAAASWGRA